jgi:NAD(P)-dependent dehydrogenase (short-subunit alcohol dehydrogenase family)
MELSGAVAVITGGTGTMGGDICRALEATGAVPVRWDAVADGQDAVSCDVSSPESVDEAMAHTVKKYGVPTVLVNAAGVSGGRSIWPDSADEDSWPLVLSSPEAWNAVMSVNVIGLSNTMRAFARQLQEAGSPGAIVNITSMSGSEMPDPMLAAYSSSKAAANMITRVAARALGPLGIRVNAVAPGVMETRMRVPAGLPSPGTTFEAEARMQRVMKSTPLDGRLTRPADITAAVIGLLGMDFVTGQVITVDGGLTLRSVSRDV